MLARYQDQFRYILVDEYQDTNFAQHSIVLQIAKNHQHVCVAVSYTHLDVYKRQARNSMSSIGSFTM